MGATEQPRQLKVAQLSELRLLTKLCVGAAQVEPPQTWWKAWRLRDRAQP